MTMSFVCRVGDGTMSLNRYSVETPEVAFLKKRPDGLNGVYRDIADEIGVKTHWRYTGCFAERKFHSRADCFQRNTYTRPLSVNMTAITYRTGTKYNYSERSVWRILKTMK